MSPAAGNRKIARLRQLAARPARHRKTGLTARAALVPVLSGTRCSRESCRENLNGFLMIKSAEEKPRLEQVKDRRSHADGDRLTAELFRRGDHPDEFTDVWTAGPAPRRKA